MSSARFRAAGTDLRRRDRMPAPRRPVELHAGQPRRPGRHNHAHPAMPSRRRRLLVPRRRGVDRFSWRPAERLRAHARASREGGARTRSASAPPLRLRTSFREIQCAVLVAHVRATAEASLSDHHPRARPRVAEVASIERSSGTGRVPPPSRRAERHDARGLVNSQQARGRWSAESEASAVARTCATSRTHWISQELVRRRSGGAEAERVRRPPPRAVPRVCAPRWRSTGS